MDRGFEFVGSGSDEFTEFGNWHRFVWRLFSVKHLQSLFWCYSEALKPYPAVLRDRVSKVLK